MFKEYARVQVGCKFCWDMYMACLLWALGWHLEIYSVGLVLVLGDEQVLPTE